MGEEDLNRLSWQGVSATVMLWAIGRIHGLPPVGTDPDENALIASVLAAPELSAGDRLRTLDELLATTANEEPPRTTTKSTKTKKADPDVRIRRQFAITCTRTLAARCR